MKLVNMEYKYRFSCKITYEIIGGYNCVKMRTYVNGINLSTIIAPRNKRYPITLLEYFKSDILYFYRDGWGKLVENGKRIL